MLYIIWFVALWLIMHQLGKELQVYHIGMYVIAYGVIDMLYVYILFDYIDPYFTLGFICGMFVILLVFTIITKKIFRWLHEKKNNRHTTQKSV